MDWTDCPDVERKPGVFSGAPVIVGTRVPPEAVIDNAEDGFTAEEISEMFPTVPVERVRHIIEFARLHVPHPAG